MQRNSKIKKLSGFLIGVILIVLMQPYFVWTWPVQIKLAIQAIPVAFFLINNNFKDGHQNVIFFAFFFFLLLFTCLNQGLALAYSLFILSFAIFPFANNEYALCVYTSFRKVLSAFLLISLIVWVFVRLGFDVPYNVIEPLNSLKPYNYNQYPFLVQSNSLEDLFRFYGPFDEPGVIGTVCAMILYVEGYNMKDFFNIPLLITGLCTFSLFFIVVTMLFLGFRLVKRPKYIFASIIAFLFFYYYTKDIDEFQYLLYDRLEYNTNTRSFEGDNRATSEFKAYYNSIKGTSTYYFGADPNVVAKFSGNAGYRNAVLKYGAIFCFLYLVCFFGYALSLGLKGRKLLIFAFLFLSVLYQRPGFLDPVYIFLFVQYIKNNVPVRKRKRVDKIGYMFAETTTV